MDEILIAVMVSAAIALPGIAVVIYQEVIAYQERRIPQGVMFSEMEEGVWYRVTVEGIQLVGAFSRYEKDAAIFADGTFIKRRIGDAVHVMPL